MATTGRSDEPATPASDVAADCRDAGLVRLLGARRGDALAAVGSLGRALADAGVPFQARLVATATQNRGATDADCTIAVGRPDLPADHAVDPAPVESTTASAASVARELGSASPVLDLASARVAPGDSAVHDEVESAGIERRPGVAVPTDDLADGLAHSTLVHAPFSGDPTAVEEALADLALSTPPSGDDHRRVASMVALAVAEAECPPQATRAVERVLHPYAGGPAETVGGYADVLDALARTDPGLGIAVALDRVDAEAGLDTWRNHGRVVHDVVANADLERHDGLAVATVAEGAAPDEPVWHDEPTGLVPVGRLVRDYRSPEPTVLVRGTDGLVVTTVDDDRDAADVLATATAEVTDATVVGDAATATVRLADGHDAVVEATRRALR